MLKLTTLEKYTYYLYGWYSDHSRCSNKKTNDFVVQREQYFSTLKRLNTCLWNTTIENRLNGFAMMNAHNNNPDDALNVLAINTRRML